MKFDVSQSSECYNLIKKVHTAERKTTGKEVTGNSKIGTNIHKGKKSNRITNRSVINWLGLIADEC